MKAIGIDINGKKITFKADSDGYVECNYNNLTSLVLPDGVTCVNCNNNPIKEIVLPKSVTLAYLPIDCIVPNINDFLNRDDVYIYFWK